jgi:hypothetical protein
MHIERQVSLQASEVQVSSNQAFATMQLEMVGTQHKFQG